MRAFLLCFVCLTLQFGLGLGGGGDPDGKVPFIQVSNPKQSFLGSLFSSTPDTEAMDVTMLKFGHKLAFHLIHPNGGKHEAPRPIPEDEEIIVTDDESLNDAEAVTDTGEDEQEIEEKIEETATTAAPVKKKCMSWRQTGNCDPKGAREAAHDQPCDAVIHKGSSGYCECEAGRRVKESTCDHESFVCENECMGTVVKPVVDYTDVQNAFERSNLFEESSPNVINRQLGMGRPFFLVVLCSCEGDLKAGTSVADSWPLQEFEIRVQEAGFRNKFTFMYALPSTAQSFSLYQQYSITKGRPWMLIDNIPNGPMNEKFLGPTVPGASADDFMGMAKQFFDYKLPLLVRSAPVPAAGVVAGDTHGRRMRGASHDSHVVQVVSDTFREVVLDPERACFLLIYSPHCPASRSVLPVLEDVGTHHRNLENVTIAKMDLIHNDLPIRDVVVRHYPTAYLFPAGKEPATGSRHPEYRTPLNFANYKGENTPHERNHAHGHWSVEEIAHFIEHEVVKTTEGGG
jgi:hypothetical protein